MMDYMAAQEETTGDQELILNDNNDEDSVYIAALGDYLEGLQPLSGGGEDL